MKWIVYWVKIIKLISLNLVFGSEWFGKLIEMPLFFKIVFNFC